MNWDRVEGNWKQVSGKVKQQWGQLTDDSLTQINGKRDELVGKIQEAYGINQATKERLKSYGWTGDLDDYLKLSAEQQLPYIEKQYSTGYRGKLTSAGRIYLVNFLPSRFFSLGPDGVIARRGDPAFATNTWLDYDNDGAITLQDLEDLADAAVNNTVKDPYGTGWSLKDRWKEIVSRL